MRKIAILGCLLLAMNGVAVDAKEAPKADNSAQNAGAERRNAVTAERQDNKKSNVEILAQIRRTIMDDNGLSMNAKNAKILFKNGLVTLKGPVDSDSEKARLEELAKSCSNVSSVKNMLTVAHKKQ